MDKKKKIKIILWIGAALMTSGVVGYSSLTILDIHRRFVENDKTKMMLRQTFERNKELSSEIEKMDLRYLDLLSEMKKKGGLDAQTQEKIAKQIDVLKNLTKDQQSIQKSRDFMSRLKIRLGENPQKVLTPGNFGQEVDETEKFMEQKLAEWKLKKDELEALKVQISVNAAREKKLQEQLVAKDLEAKTLQKAAQEQVEKNTKKIEIPSQVQIEKPQIAVQAEKKTPKEPLQEPQKRSRDLETQPEPEVKKTKSSRDEEKSVILYNLGVAYLSTGLYADAAKSFEKSLEINPNDASSHYNVAILYDDHLNNTDRAIMHYMRFIELSDNPEKKRQVMNWMQISKTKNKTMIQSRKTSAGESFKKIFLTTAG